MTHNNHTPHRDGMKTLTNVHTTENRIIHTAPVAIHGILLTTASAPGVCQIHDGHDANAPIVFRLETDANPTVSLIVNTPVLLSRGMFVQVDAATTHVTVMFEPIPRKL